MPVVMTRPGSDAAAAASRPGWLGSLGIAAGGAVASMVAMFWLRSAYQIRTLPERVLEWVLLFVPPDTLERGISQFGAQAKKTTSALVLRNRHVIECDGGGVQPDQIPAPDEHRGDLRAADLAERSDRLPGEGGTGERGEVGDFSLHPDATEKTPGDARIQPVAPVGHGEIADLGELHGRRACRSLIGRHVTDDGLLTRGSRPRVQPGGSDTGREGRWVRAGT